MSERGLLFCALNCKYFITIGYLGNKFVTVSLNKPLLLSPIRLPPGFHPALALGRFPRCNSWARDSFTFIGKFQENGLKCSGKLTKKGERAKKIMDSAVIQLWLHCTGNHPSEIPAGCQWDLRFDILICWTMGPSRHFQKDRCYSTTLK